MESINDLFTVGDDGVYRPKEMSAPEKNNEEQHVEEQKTEEQNTEEKENEEVIEQENNEVEKENIETNQQEQEFVSEDNQDNKINKTVDSLSDESVLNYLSEKLGKQFSSFEDLTAGNESEQQPSTDLDKALQDLKDWSLKSGLPIQDYFKYQKDYDSMSNIEKIEQHVRYKHPDFTNEEVKLEMDQYIPDEDSDDDREIALKNLNQKKAAKDALEVLNTLKTEITDYKIETSLSDDQKSDLELAGSYKQLQRDQEEYSRVYNERIKEESTRLKSIPLQLDDDLTIDYNVEETDRVGMTDFINKMPHWYNEDGSIKHDSVVKDGAIIKNFPKMLKIAYGQGISKGQDMLLDQANNSTLSKSQQQKTFANQEGGSGNRPKFENVSKDLASFVDRLK